MTCKCGKPISIELGTAYVLQSGKVRGECRSCILEGNAARNRENASGIGSDVYIRELDRQAGRCAVCGCRATGRALSVDVIRGRLIGLLCIRCLQAIKVARRNEDSFAHYLRGNSDAY